MFNILGNTPEPTAPQGGQGQSQGQSQGQPQPQPQSQQPVSKPPLLSPLAPKKNTKKTLLMIGSIFGGFIVLFLIFAFISIAMAQEGKDFALTTLFGATSAGFLNALVTGVHISMFIIAVAILVPLLISLFKMMLAKKEDVEKKKKAKKNMIISGILLFVLLIGWIVAFVYLEGRRDVLKINVEYPPILTTPAETIQLTAPIIIKFDATHVPVDSSLFQILSYDWDFGDGQVGTSKITTHEYKKKGRFDVILEVTKRSKTTAEETKDTYAKTITIDNQELTATFKADPQSGEAPLIVKFDASESMDPDGKIDTYEWDLDGDGEFDNAYKGKKEVEYEYKKIGNYEVTLRVTSMSGDYNIATKQIVVGVGETPEAVIEVEDSPKVFEKGVSYIFKAGESTSPNGNIDSYEWDFGDGSTKETTKTVSHKFTKEGVFQVILKVVDEDEKKGEALLEIIIGDKPGMPTAVIKTNPTLTNGALALEGKIPFQVSFNGGDSTDFDNNIVDYEWDFNDDGKADSFGKNITHSFTEEGTYTVRLTVIDAEENYDSATIGVKVVPQGMQAILKSEPTNGEVPLTVRFDASGSVHPGSNISSYQWDFGDGTNPILGSAKINHKYTSIGEYTAKVTVIGSDNSKDTAESNIVVRAIEVSACFKGAPTKGLAPLTVVFDPTCSSGTITSYDWNFGDGENSNDVKPTHVFENPGVYPVVLEVLDNNNTVSTTTVNIEVTETE